MGLNKQTREASVWSPLQLLEKRKDREQSEEDLTVKGVGRKELQENTGKEGLIGQDRKRMI